MLNWEETDFIECFEVDSFFEEQDQAYEFNIVGDTIDAQVRVLPSDDIVSVRTISKKSGSYITESFYLVLGEISYDRSSQVISLSDAIPVDDEFYYSHFKKEELPSGYRFIVELGIKPEFHMNSVLK